MQCFLDYGGGRWWQASCAWNELKSKKRLLDFLIFLSVYIYVYRIHSQGVLSVVWAECLEFTIVWLPEPEVSVGCG